MNDLNRQELSERIQRALQRQRMITRWTSFALNACAFLVCALLLISTLSDPNSYAYRIPTQSREIFIVPMALWFMALLSHLYAALHEQGVFDKQIIAQVMTQELGQQIVEESLRQAADKPKRDAARLDADAVTINDEGELVPLDEAQPRQRPVTGTGT